jgi:DNA invertase Pin-like site-specific DNA recombinase
MRAAIYTRVSTDEQASEGFSLGDQERQGARQDRARGLGARRDVQRPRRVRRRIASAPA